MQRIAPFAIFFLLLVASNAAESQGSRSIEGVTATFRITTPIIKRGGKLNVVTTYHNAGSTMVRFQFMPDPSHFSNIFRRGERNHVTGYYFGHPAVEQVTLKPSESVTFKEEVDLRAFEDLPTGDYEIQFSYHLAMLLPEKREKYLKEYPHEGLVIPWSDQRYQFTILHPFLWYLAQPTLVLACIGTIGVGFAVAAFRRRQLRSMHGAVTASTI